MHRAKPLDGRATPLTAGDIPARTDVFIHDLEPFTLEALRWAVGKGLTPTGLDFTRDDDYPEDNEVVGKVYDAESQLKYATGPRDAHLAGSVRATVSRLLRELAAKVAGDPSF